MWIIKLLRRVFGSEFVNENHENHFRMWAYISEHIEKTGWATTTEAKKAALKALGIPFESTGPRECFACVECCGECVDCPLTWNEGDIGPFPCLFGGSSYVFWGHALAADDFTLAAYHARVIANMEWKQ